jgi:hypothetical protein
MPKPKSPKTKVNLSPTAEAIQQIAEASLNIDYAQVFKSIVEKHSNDKKWALGDFVGIKILSNTKVGTVGQDFIESLCGILKVPIIFPINKSSQRMTQNPWDIKLFDITFELKTATEDVGGKFQFNHIRYHRDYNAVLCLGVSPNELLFNIYSKAEIATGKAGKLVSMEKGGNASYKLTKSKHELFHIDSFKEKLTQFAADFK